jgi:hypothetical protein
MGGGNAEVRAFPLHRQRKLVSGIARVLGAKQGEDATRFWRDTAKGLLQRLTANGVGQQAAEEEVRGLLYAVLSELEINAAEARG